MGFKIRQARICRLGLVFLTMQQAGCLQLYMHWITEYSQTPEEAFHRWGNLAHRIVKFRVPVSLLFWLLVCFSSREWPFAGEALSPVWFPSPKNVSIRVQRVNIWFFFFFHEWKHNSHNESNRKLSCSNKTCVFSTFYSDGKTTQFYVEQVLHLDTTLLFRTSITQLETLALCLPLATLSFNFNLSSTCLEFWESRSSTGLVTKLQPRSLPLGVQLWDLILLILASRSLNACCFPSF